MRKSLQRRIKFNNSNGREGTLNFNSVWAQLKNALSHSTTHSSKECEHYLLLALFFFFGLLKGMLFVQKERRSNLSQQLHGCDPTRESQNN